MYNIRDMVSGHSCVMRGFLGSSRSCPFPGSVAAFGGSLWVLAEGVSAWICVWTNSGHCPAEQSWDSSWLPQPQFPYLSSPGSCEWERKPSMQTSGAEADAQYMIDWFYCLGVVPGCIPLLDCWFLAEFLVLMNEWVVERMRSVDCPFSWCFIFSKVHSIKKIRSSCLNNKMFYSPELLWTQWGAW